MSYVLLLLSMLVRLKRDFGDGGSEEVAAAAAVDMLGVSIGERLLLQSESF